MKSQSTELLPDIQNGGVSSAGQPKFFYGWIIALVSGLGIACGVSVFIPATIGFLVAPLTAEFGWTPPQLFLAVTFATISTVLVAPFIGGFVDKVGARRVLMFSFICEALIILSFKYLDSNLVWFYARYSALAILATGSTAVTYAKIISRWFDRRRGLALGIALAGVGVGGVIWSLATRWLIDHVGWRDTFPCIAGFVAFVALPIVLLTLRESPESMGLQMDGDPAPARGTRGSISGVTLREAARDRQFWLMALTFLLFAFVAQSMIIQLVPLMRAKGETAQLAAAAQASMWAVLSVGRLTTGWLMDRFFAPRVAMTFVLIAAVGIAILASGASGGWSFAGAMMIGLATGAEVDVIAYLVSRYFGLAHYGVIYATFFSVYVTGAGIGPPTTAWLVQRAGGYGPALWLLSAVLCTVAFLFVFYRRFERPQPAQMVTVAAR